jgi:hypothetical protein
MIAIALDVSILDLLKEWCNNYENNSCYW